MDQYQLKQHIDRFGQRKGKYILEVECSKTFAGIKVSDGTVAFMLCETAMKTGLAKYIRLYYHPNEDTEHVLFDSDVSVLLTPYRQV